MLESIRLRALLHWQQATKALFGLSFLLLSMAGVSVQAQTNIDLLVNHQAGMAFYGIEGDGSQVNGPAGAEYLYQARVRINGAPGLSIEQVTLTQVLPVGAIFKGIDAPAGTTCATQLVDGTAITAANQEILCAIPRVTSDAFVDVDFRVILPTVSASWRATVSATAANNNDPEEGNSSNLPRNISTFEAADLSIEFTAPVPGAEVIEGVEFQYQLLVRNKATPFGKDLVTGEQAIVRFEQPAGVLFAGNPSGNGWQCQSIGGASTIWECVYRVTNTIPVNTDLPLLTVPAASQQVGAITATASVSSTNASQQPVRDVDPSDNTETVTVHSEADNFTNVTLSKNVQPTTLDQQGGDQEVRYTLTPFWASGTGSPGTVTVTDPLPAGVSINTAAVQEANRESWDCSASTAQQVRCTFAADASNYPLRGHAFPAIVVPAQVAGNTAQNGGSIVNTATVSATGEHPDRTDDNSASATISISNQAILNMSKRPVAAGGGNVGVVRNGTVFAYQLQIRNEGPVALLPGHSITLEDPLQPFLRFVAATDSNSASTPSSTRWNCSDTNALVRCTYSVEEAVPAGAAIDLFLWVEVVDIPENGNAVLSNTAQLTGIDGRDPLPAETGIGISPDVNASDKSADLAISKLAAFADDARSGDLVTYTLNVTNAGNDSNQAARTVRVEDNITNLITAAYAQAPFNIAPIPANSEAPAGTYWYNDYLTVQLTGSGNAQDSCSLGGYNSNQTNANLVCTFNDMPVNASYTITIQAKQFVDPYTGTNPHDPTQIVANGIDGVLRNTATVSSPDTNDSDTSNNSATAYVTMQALTDIAISRQASPLNANGQAQAAAGGAISYVLTVANNGPSAASQVALQDRLPLGAYWIGSPPIATGNGVCGYRLTPGGSLQTYRDGDLITAQNQNLVCEWGGNFARGQETLSYRLRSEQEGQTQLNSVAEVSTETPEVDLTNNSAAQTVLLTPPQVDVLIEMRHTADGIPLGQSTTYTITVTNNAASDSYARDVVMNNQFHSQLIREGRPPLPSTAIFRFDQITALISHGRDPGAAAFTADNCSVDTTEGAGGLQCDFPWMAPGESVDISFTMTAQSIPNGRAVGTIYHNATVTAALESHQEFDVLANNTTQDRTSTYDPALVDNGSGPPVLADLELSKSVQSISHANPAAAETDPVTGGSTVQYQLVVRNLETVSTQIASNIVVTDVLAAGLSLVEDSLPEGCAYDADSRTLSCLIGSLAPEQALSLSFSVVLDTPYNETGATLVNCAAVTSAFDPVDDNNSDCVEIPATPTPPPEPVFADLVLSKSVQSISHANPDAADSDPVTEGSTVQYQLVVRNLETDATQIASNVVLADVLPAGVSLVEGSLPDSCSYATDSRTISCVLGSLAAAQELSLSFSVVLDTPYSVSGANLVNCAAVTSDNDPNEANNSACVQTPAQPPEPVSADLALSKSVQSISHANPDAADSDPLTAGSTVQYQIVVRNLETNTAQVASNVVVADVLAAGVSLVEGSLPESCTYATDSRTISCVIGLLEAEQELSLSFSVVLDTPLSVTGTNLVNCAAVTSENDPVEANNSDCAQTPVAPTVDPEPPGPSAPPVPVPSLNLGAVALLALFMMAMAWRIRRRGG